MIYGVCTDRTDRTIFFYFFWVLNRQPPTISNLLVFINLGLTSHMETGKKILVHGYGW